MNPLPPLPLVDGAFLIDNSSLEHYQSCRRHYELSDIRRYAIVSNAAGRNFGSAIHVGLQTRYRLAGSSKPSAEVVAACNDAIAAYFASNPAPVDDFRDAAHAQRMMTYYNDHYGAEPFRVLPFSQERLLVERSFSLELGTVQNVPIIWTGKLDLVIEDNDGIWNMDHKTTFQFGSGFEDDMSTNGGQLGYTWALSKILGRKPAGYRINGIRVRKPSRAAKYAAEGGGPAPIDASDFIRIPHHVSQDDLDEWREDVLALITDLFFNHDRGYFPRSRKSCSGKYGRCDFFEVCTAPRATRQQILDSSLFQSNTWSPLNQANQTT